MALREIWAAYECAWSENDPGKRAAILRQTLDVNFTYSDPVTRTESHAALSDYIGELQRSIPGLSIATTSFVEHHEACLVTWTLHDDNSNAVAHGVTCGEVHEAGLLKKAMVFYDLPRASQE